jgi:hypothetical protein
MAFLAVLGACSAYAVTGDDVKSVMDTQSAADYCKAVARDAGTHAAFAACAREAGAK